MPSPSDLAVAMWARRAVALRRTLERLRAEEPPDRPAVEAVEAALVHACRMHGVCPPELAAPTA